MDEETDFADVKSESEPEDEADNDGCDDSLMINSSRSSRRV